MTGATGVRSRAAALAGRVGPGVVDSAVASARNLVLGVLAAHALGLEGFGWFSTAVLVQLVATGASKAVHADPLVLAHPTAGDRSWRSTASAAAGAVLASSGVVAALAVVAASVARAVGASELAGVLLAVALVLPGVLLLDLLRWAAHARQRGPLAVRGSLVNATVSVAAVGGAALGGSSPAVLVLASGAGAVPATLVLLRALGVVPRPGGLRAWYAEHRRWSVGLALDWLLLQLTAEGAFLLIALLTTAEQVGELRKAQLPLAPAVVLTTGLVVFLQPALSRAAASGVAAAGTARSARRVAAGVAAVTAAWVLLVAITPPAWMDLLVGGDWARARSYLWPLGIGVVAGAAAAPLGIALRVLGRLGDQVRWRTWTAAPVLAGTTVSALAGGALAASWWVAGATVVVTVTWLALTLRPARPVPAPRPQAGAEAGSRDARMAPVRFP